MARLEFIAAIYNEEQELADLIGHVAPYVHKMNFVDDGSTDQTEDILEEYSKSYRIEWRTIAHTGLPETVKNEALKLVADDSWVLMLDADERLAPGVLEDVSHWISDGMNVHGISDEISHVYFHQIEIIDNKAVREFQKSKLFKKEAITFPLNNIHMDDTFTGDGLYKEDWLVFHRKTSTKQIEREREYIKTYEKLLYEDKIDEGRFKWLKGLHHYIRD